MSDTLLINQFNGRDNEAWDKIYSMFYDRLFYSIKGIIHNEEYAKEIANDCFVRIYEDKLQFEAIKQLEAFLFIKAKNDALNYLKSSVRKEDNSTEFGPVHDTPADIEDALDREFDHKSLLNDIIQEIQQHPRKRREVFELFYFGKKSAIEIAAIKGIHPSRVYAYKKKLLKVLKDKFGPDVDKLIYMLFMVSCLLEFIT